MPNSLRLLASDRSGAEQLQGGKERRQILVGAGLGECLGQRVIVRGLSGLEQSDALGGHVGINATPIGRAEKTRQQSALFEPRNQSRGRALAEDNRVGNLLHVQMATRATVLAAENGEQNKFAHADAVIGRERPFHLALNPLVELRKLAPTF